MSQHRRLGHMEWWEHVSQYDKPLFPDGHSIGSIGCNRCNVDYDLGASDASAHRIMDLFFDAHSHAGEA